MFAFRIHVHILVACSQSGDVFVYRVKGRSPFRQSANMLPEYQYASYEHEISNILIEYGHEAKPYILGLQIIFLAAPRDYHHDGGDYRARLEL